LEGFDLKEKTWKEMGFLDKLKYSDYAVAWYVSYLVFASLFSIVNHWAALPLAVLAVVFAVQMEQSKTRKILLDELRGGK